MPEEMPPAEQEHWDARAAVEAWDSALWILEPWVASARSDQNG